MVIPYFFFLYVRLFNAVFQTADGKEISGVGRDCSNNCATTTCCPSRCFSCTTILSKTGFVSILPTSTQCHHPLVPRRRSTLVSYSIHVKVFFFISADLCISFKAVFKQGQSCCTSPSTKVLHAIAIGSSQLKSGFRQKQCNIQKHVLYEGGQCDQMVRLFFNILSFTSMKICPVA